MSRRTLKAPVRLEGVGLHSGASSGVSLWPASSGQGYRMRFGSADYLLSSAKYSGDGRGTVLTFDDHRLMTVEHLLGALRGLQIDDVIIEPLGPEIPLLDGGALPFCQAIESSGIVEIQGTPDPVQISSPLAVESPDGRKYVAAMPSDRLRFTYIIDYPGTMIGTQIATVEPSAENFAEELGQCRTFCLLQEVEQMRAAGLGLGGTVETALIVDGQKVLTPGGTRRDDEFVRHKILDMMGDLALIGRPVIGHFVAIRAGHSMHLKLMERIARSSQVL